MSDPPTLVRIPELRVDGFAATAAVKGQTVKIIQSMMITSDKPLFYVYATQILRLASQHWAEPLPPIDRLLVLIHENESADVYVNNFQILVKATVTRTVEAGEPLYRGDLSTINEVHFPSVDINQRDKIIFIGRNEWRFGLYFNFCREIAQEKCSTDIAELLNELLLVDFFAMMTALVTQVSPLNYDAFIITEGKSDWRHLQRAARELEIDGICYDQSDRDRGDDFLLKVCIEMSTIPQSKPVIFLFDRDNPKIIDRLLGVKDNRLYHDWGNNVFSMLLPVPRHRAGYKRISIEMYYSDEVLKRPDGQGRRLCFDNEVRTEVYRGLRQRRVLMNPNADHEYDKTIIGQDVDDIEDEAGRKIGLSKTAFAEKILLSQEPFQTIDTTAFSEIFSVFFEIIKHASGHREGATVR
jgi:hypothetical protein